MKKIILLFFISLQTFSQKNNIEIEYCQAINSRDIIKSNKSKILKGISYILRFNDIESVFYTTTQIDPDNFETIGRHIINVVGTAKFYNNLITGEKITDVDYLGESFLIKEKTFKGKWELYNETKNIDNYKCYKAVYTETYKGVKSYFTAWYTLDLPFPYGPLRFEGLPGIILELNHYNYTLTAKRISLFQNFKIKKPKGKTYTQEQFFKLMKKKTGF